MSTAEATIYLAGRRGRSQTDIYRSDHTLSFETYVREGRGTFGNLQALNDDTLGAGGKRTLTASADRIVWLIPLIGALRYQTTTGVQATLEPGQTHSLRLPAGTALQVINPYEDERINYLHVWLTSGPPTHTIEVQEYTILLDQQNQLTSIGDHAAPDLRMGRYQGRAEEVYRPRDAAKGIFAFVIHGAFEIENRLLEFRDAIALWNTPEVTFEALSNDAIVLFIEP
ncbi:pirin family protein [Dawidia soli]|uniref:Pirin n=1 Tax=Dawidia soli TaxID=2782352 RepID=A0AAP2GF44_9BACT|nr:pirin [Dawidia soli]MBT1689107.1 pirin [Dawidia soli]